MVIKKNTVSWPIWWLSFVVVESLSHVWLFCDPMDCSLLHSSVRGISQARILDWVTISFSEGFSCPRDRIHVSYIAGSLHCVQILYCWATREAALHAEWVSEVTQSCSTLCDPIDYSLPGSFVHGIFQARVLEWVAISFSSSAHYLILKDHWLFTSNANWAGCPGFAGYGGGLVSYFW